MFRSFSPLAAGAVLSGALALSATSLAAQTPVQEVTVETDLTAIENVPAARYWTSISDDLENAIVARLVDQIAEDGVKVFVDIDEVTLASSLQSALDTEQSMLKGNVNVTHDTDNSLFDSYDLTVTFTQATPFLPPGTDLTAIATDSREYYDAMLATFAEAVAAKLR